VSTFDPDGPATATSGIYGLEDGEDEAKVVLLSAPFEATTSYGCGASKGPEAISRASKQVDLYDAEIGTPYKSGIVMVPADPSIATLNESATAAAREVIAALEAGAEWTEALESKREQVNQAGAKVDALIYEATKQRLDAGKTVGVVGGDHSVPLGAIRAHGEHYGDFGILQIDAHADLRVAYQGFTYSHASIMNLVLERVPQVVRLTQVAIRDLCDAEYERIRTEDRITTYFDARLARARMEGRLLPAFGAVIDSLPRQVYVSFDIDGLDPRLCPNTGTPVPGGLNLHEFSFLLEKVVRSGRKIIGFDITEVAPGPDGDEWDGNVGARALYKMIGWTLHGGSY